MSRERPFAEAVSIRGGRFSSVGSVADVMREKGPATRVIDVGGGTVIPGLNDSHTHPIRGGLYYNLELRWDGVPSLSDALALLKEQARRTPPPHWVRVVGGWSAFQFKERRLPTLEEINAAAPDTPVFILHLYDRAWLNGAALRAVGYTKDTPEPPGGEIQRDKSGNPTGLLVARPNAWILYSTLAKGPKLSFDEQLNSSRRFMRELNRLGVTSVIDAGGGFQNYPDDYKVIQELARQGQLTTRFAYHLFTQRPKGELEDFQRWSGMVKPGQGDDFLRLNGAGEMLAYSAADFEDFLEPRPDMPANMEPDLKAVVTHLAKSRWPFRLHATYDETITRALDVFETREPGRPLRRPALVLRPRRDDLAAEHRAREGARRRHRDPAPDGLPGRVLRRALRGQGGRERAAHRAHAADGRARGRGDRCHARRQLQPLRLPLLARHGQDARRHASLRRGQPPRPDGRAAPVDGRERVVLGRRRPEGNDGPRPARRPGRPLGRLLLRAGGADQGTRVRPHARRGQGGARRAGVRLARAAAAPGRAELGTRHGRRVARRRKPEPGAALLDAHAGHTHRSRAVGCSCFPA